jgi:hypothetical protein
MGRTLGVSPLRITRATRNRASDITNLDLERVNQVTRALVRAKGDRNALSEADKASLTQLKKRGGAANSLMNRALNGNQSLRRAIAQRTSAEMRLRKDPNYRGQPGGTGQMPRQGLGPLAPRA